MIVPTLLGLGASSRKHAFHRWVEASVALSLFALTAAASPAAARASVTPTARPSAAASECKNVEFIGDRGSGEKYDQARRPFRGLGPEVNKMVSVVQGMLRKKGITYGTDAVPYPADSVNVLDPSAQEIALFAADFGAGAEYYYQHNLKKYLASIAKGVSYTIDDMRAWHHTCPATVFVLAGYSQGAMVVHRAELREKADHLTGLTSAIAGTLLLGDGLRVPHTKAREFGSSGARSEGISTYLEKYLRVLGTSRDVLQPGTTANICNGHDVVCNFNLYAILHFSKASKVHTSYAVCRKDNRCSYERVLTSAATWVGRAVVRRLRG